MCLLICMSVCALVCMRQCVSVGGVEKIKCQRKRTRNCARATLDICTREAIGGREVKMRNGFPIILFLFFPEGEYWICSLLRRGGSQICFIISLLFFLVFFLGFFLRSIVKGLVSLEKK